VCYTELVFARPHASPLGSSFVWGCRRDHANLIFHLYCSVHSPGSYLQLTIQTGGWRWESLFPPRPFFLDVVATVWVFHTNINSLSQHLCEIDFVSYFTVEKGSLGIWKTKVTINFHPILSKHVFENSDRFVSPVWAHSLSSFRAPIQNEKFLGLLKVTGVFLQPSLIKEGALPLYQFLKNTQTPRKLHLEVENCKQWKEVGAFGIKSVGNSMYFSSHDA